MPPSTLYTGQREIGHAMVDRVQLPAMIPCSVCKKNKPQNQFSNKQQNDLKKRIARHGRATIRPENSIRCFQCTGTQNVEMRCILCGTTKELDGFAKAQRSNPDKAKCKECMKARDLVLPADSEHVDEDEHEHHDDDAASQRPHEVPWERDGYSGQYVLEKAQKEAKGKSRASMATGSSRELSGYDTSERSISGYSAVPLNVGRVRSNLQGASAASAAEDERFCGVDLNTWERSNATGLKLTPGNLANLEAGPTAMFGKLNLNDPDASGNESDDGLDARTTSAATVQGRRGPPSVSNSVFTTGKDVYDISDEDDSDDDRRPQRIAVTKAESSKYTAMDQNGNPHQIAATASITSGYAPSSGIAPSSGTWSTVNKNKKISHSGFSLKTDPFGRSHENRKFPRIRPQNLETSKLQESLVHRIDDDEKKRPSYRPMRRPDDEDDEDY